jgi:hypothetical protein
MRDVVADLQSGESAGKCAAYVEAQLLTIAGRAERRGEGSLDISEVVDLVVAPIVYRALFGDGSDDSLAAVFVDRVLELQGQSAPQASKRVTRATP